MDKKIISTLNRGCYFNLSKKKKKTKGVTCDIRQLSSSKVLSLSAESRDHFSAYSNRLFVSKESKQKNK